MTAQTTVADTTRHRAGQVVADLAERLRDPGRVEAAATTEDNADYWEGMPAPRPPWTGLSLGEGHAAVAVLYAELAGTAPEHRETAHAHLAAATRAAAPPGERAGLFSGATSLAYAARTAQRDPGDYATLLDRLDPRVTARSDGLLDQEEERLDSGRAGAAAEVFDVVNGVTGLGRYLLMAGPRHRGHLERVLSYLVRLTRPVRAHGHTVPGWWSPVWPALEGPGAELGFARGHLNPGVAHGVGGPLALLSLGWEAGVRVPGHEEAVDLVVDHLLSRQPGHGLWPTTIGFDEFVAGQDRSPIADDNPLSWCYGTPGVARALFLAGRAFGRPDWRQRAVRALDGALALAAPPYLTDSTLCHGWAGLLHITWRTARDSGDARLAARLPELAAAVVSAYDPGLPFGFAYRRPLSGPGWRVAPHQAGFLKGAAGIALALNAYATGAEPHRDWDAALLLN